MLLYKEFEPIRYGELYTATRFQNAAFLASGHVLHAKDSNNGFLALETRLVLNHFDGVLAEYCGLGDISAGSQLKVKAITAGSLLS